MSDDARVYPEWVTTESERKLHDDFVTFCWLLWQHLKLPTPTKRQRAMMRYLQHGPRRRMLQAWRGAAKTWITCAYALWRLYRNPNERVKIVSANEDKALENATFIRRLIDEVPQLQFLRPRKGQRDATTAFDVGPSDAHPTPSVTAVGITGQLTGGRSTLLISDDVEVPKNSYTETMRERLAELVKEYDALVVPEGFDIIFLGTPQSEQSVYNVVRQRGYDCRIWPARFPTAEKLATYGDALAPDILQDWTPENVGRTVEPERFSDIDLAEREGSYGRSGFALQFMLDTTLSDAERYPLKLSDLIVMDVDREVGHVKLTWASGPQQVITELENPGLQGDRFHRPLYVSQDVAPWQGTVMIVDPSGRGQDETAYAVLRSLNGMIYLVASGGLRGGATPENLTLLSVIARDYGVKEIEVEDNFGDGMFTSLFEPYFTRIDPETGQPFYPVTITEYKSTGQKELRIIEDLEPVLTQHRLVVDKRVVQDDLKVAADEPKYSLFYQLTHITKERGALRHDDRLEAVARGCRYFRTQLAKNIERAEAEHKQRLKDQQLEEFMKVAGRPLVKLNPLGLPRGLDFSTRQGVLRAREPRTGLLRQR